MKSPFRAGARYFLALCPLITAAAGQTETQQFAGLNFGIGISLTIDTGDHDRVSDAAVVDGIVRVNEQQDKVARVMLESHYFFPSSQKRLLGMVDAENWGMGPFIALQPGTDEIIEAVALGLMVGFRRDNDESGSSWNLGIGWVTDPNVKILGDGFAANQPPPGTETEVRFKQTSQDGIVFIVSFSF